MEFDGQMTSSHMRGEDGADRGKRPAPFRFERVRSAIIAGEILVCYLLIYVSAWRDWQMHQYFRFLTLIPIYQAGVAFGFSAAVINATTVSVLFFPVLRIDKAIYGVPGGMHAGIAMIVFINVFGVFVGAVIGRSRKTRKYINALNDASLRIARETDETRALIRLAAEARELVSAEYSAALVIQDDRGRAEKRRMYGMSPAGEPVEIREYSAGHPLLWAARMKEELISNSTEFDPRFAGRPAGLPGAAAMVLPVMSGENVYGALFLYSKSDGEPFSSKDAAVARGAAARSAMTIDNIRQERKRLERKAEEERMGEIFSRFVSPQVADHILNNPDSFKSRRQDMTILVSDIRGFTRIAEQMRPEDLVKRLNEYFTAIVEVVIENGGAVDKFIGDCVVAYWGAPAPDPDHARHAAKAALRMTKALDALNARWEEKGLTPFHAGIGLHTCRALMGNIGNDDKKAFTIVGEEIGDALEIESLTKESGARVIASALTAEALGTDFVLEKLPFGERGNFGPLFAVKT